MIATWLLGCDDGTAALRERLTTEGYEVLEVEVTGDETFEWLGRKDGQYCKGVEGGSSTSIGCFTSSTRSSFSSCDGPDGAFGTAWRCDHEGDGEACVARGERSAESNPDRAAADYERGCGLGSGRACRLRGNQLRTDPPDDCASPAVDWWRKGGEAGDARAWNALGVWLDHCPDGDLAAARDAFRRSCDAGHGQACHNLGLSLAKGRGGPEAPHEAHLAYRKACELPDAHFASCADAALEPWRAQDGAEALGLWERGCTHGDAKSCRNAGVVLRDGAHGAPKDPRRGRERLQRACDLGETEVCEKEKLTPKGGG